MNWSKELLRINKRNVIALITIVLLIGLLDAKNADDSLYKSLQIGPLTYYDLPIWEFFVAVGTISAVIVALFASYRSIEIERKQSEHIERQLRIEQIPHVVINDRIGTAGSGSDERLHIINLGNVGRGSAITITLTADPEGKISIIEASRSHSINLSAGENYNNWTIDEAQVIKGLIKQGKRNVTSVVQDIPPEGDLSAINKHKADFYLYIWYGDQLGDKYRTKVKVRHALVNSAHFFKIMENKKNKVV